MITSAKTSRNIVPRAHKLAVKLGLIRPGMDVLDYGAGRFDKAARYLCDNVLHDINNSDQDNYFEVYRYDPQLPGTSHHIIQDRYDLVFLANVLNVIPSENDRIETLRKAFDTVKPLGHMLVQVYTGDRSGQGTVTRDGYQANMKGPDLINPLLYSIYDRHYSGYKRYGDIYVLYKEGSLICCNCDRSCSCHSRYCQAHA